MNKKLKIQIDDRQLCHFDHFSLFFSKMINLMELALKFPLKGIIHDLIFYF